MSRFRTSPIVALGLVTLASFATAQAPEPPAPPAIGPFTVAPHWSPYDYPKEIGEGRAYHIIQKGDTLWDLAGRYLQNPFLWPQLWEANPYIKRARLIYPGDPVLLPTVQTVPTDAAAATETAAPAAATTSGPVDDGTTLLGGREYTLFAGYSLASPEDESLKVKAVEQEVGTDIAKMDALPRDVIYLRGGASAGVRVGNNYLVNRRARVVKHPVTGRKIGYKIDTLGIARVIRVSEDTSHAVVDVAGREIEAGDYLVPFAEPTVPRIQRSLFQGSGAMEIPADTSSAGYIVDLDDDTSYAAAGSTMTVDLGTVAGLSPGKTLTIYRQALSSDPLSKRFLASAVVVSARESFSVARVVYSREEIEPGDRVLIGR